MAWRPCTCTWAAIVATHGAVAGTKLAVAVVPRCRRAATATLPGRAPLPLLLLLLQENPLVLRMLSNPKNRQQVLNFRSMYVMADLADEGDAGATNQKVRGGPEACVRGWARQPPSASALRRCP